MKKGVIMAFEVLEPSNFKDFLVDSWEYAPWAWDFVILAYLLSNIFDIATKKNDFLKSNKRFVRTLGVILAGLTALAFAQKDISIASSPQWIIFLVCLIFSLFIYQLFKSWFPEKNLLCIGLSMLFFLFMFSWIIAAGKPTYYEQNSALASVISYISEIAFFLLIFGMFGAFNSERKGPSTEGLGNLWNNTTKKVSDWNKKRKENKVNVKLDEAVKSAESSKESLKAAEDLLSDIKIADLSVQNLTKTNNEIKSLFDKIIEQNINKFVNDVDIVKKEFNKYSKAVLDFPLKDLQRDIALVKKRIDNTKRILTDDEKNYYEVEEVARLLDLYVSIKDSLDVVKAQFDEVKRQFEELEKDNPLLDGRHIDVLNDLGKRYSLLLDSAIIIKDKIIKKDGDLSELKRDQAKIDSDLKILDEEQRTMLRELWERLNKYRIKLFSTIGKELDRINKLLDADLKSKMSEMNQIIIQIIDELTKREKAHKEEFEETARLQNLADELKKQEKLVNDVLRSTINVVSEASQNKRFLSYVEGKSISKKKSISPSEARKKIVDYLEKKLYPPILAALEKIPAEIDLGKRVVNDILRVVPKSEESGFDKQLINLGHYVMLNEEGITKDITDIQKYLQNLAYSIQTILSKPEGEDNKEVIRLTSELMKDSYLADLISKEEKLKEFGIKLEECVDIIKKLVKK